jgi:hypothetical protein
MIVRTVFAITFGRGNFAKALLQIAVILCTAILIGWQTSGIVKANAFQLQAFPLLCSSIFVVQLVVAFGYISSYSTTSRINTFLQLLYCLPLSHRQLWLCQMLPNLVLTIITAPLIAFPLWPLLAAAHVWPIIGICSILIGALSAWGLLFGIPLPRKLMPLIIGTLWWTEYKIIHLIQIPATHPGLAWLFLILISFLCLLGLLHTYSVKRPHTLSTKQVWSAEFHYPYLLKKIIRANSTRLSLATTFAISVVIVLICNTHAVQDATLYSFLVALMSSLFVADIRALCRRINPAEITVLEGTPRFIAQQAAGAIFCASIVVLPIIWALAQLNLPMAISHLALGVGIGYLVGTVIIPEQRDISGQCAATFISIGLLLGLPKLLVFTSFSQLQILLFYLCCGIGCIGTSLLIEYKRNSFNWRNHANK